MRIIVPSTNSAVPSFSATMQTPESTAALTSMPVPTTGDSVVSSGTACLCMFEPISARVGSSDCRKGIRAVATEKIILGETSMYSNIDFEYWEVSVRYRPETVRLIKCPSASSLAEACATW